MGKSIGTKIFISNIFSFDLIYCNVTMSYVKFPSQNIWASVKLPINSYNMFIITFILIILSEKLTNMKNKFRFR